jgi:hypothetical protein
MDLSGVTVELADPQGQLLEEIANPKMKRRDVAQTYAFALRSHARVNWLLVNGAIIDRWSVSGLRYIKDAAWKQQQPSRP